MPRTSTDYQSAIDDSTQDVVRFQADYQNAVSDVFTVRNKFYYRGLDWNSIGTLINGVIPDLDQFFMPTGTLSVSRSLVVLDDKQDWIGNQIEALVQRQHRLDLAQPGRRLRARESLRQVHARRRLSAGRAAARSRRADAGPADGAAAVRPGG